MRAILVAATILLAACEQTPAEGARAEASLRNHMQDLQTKINAHENLVGCTVTKVEYLMIIRCPKSDTTTHYVYGKSRHTVSVSDDT